jgi:hypothetical protein
VQRTARRFAEVFGQKDQGDDNEQRQNGAPSSNLLSLHWMRASKVSARSALMISLSG